MKTTNEEVQNKRSLTKGIIAIACACALALVGVYAYLTATDQVKNIFGFADKLDIEVVEPNWDPANAQNLLPTQTVTKDPALHNPNKADVYVFADVVIPQKDIVTANADGTLNESAVVDLFSYELNDGWTLKDTLAGDDGTVTYRYVYNDVVPAGETSGSIFDQVAIVNYVNEQFNTEELAQQIVINGYGAQAVGFANAEDAYAAQFGENEKTIVTDITVNDDSIVAASEYEVKQVETMSVASLSTAQVDDQVVFEDVELVEDAKYAIVPAGASVDNAIAEFTADEATVAESANGLLLDNLPKTAFAVYSADDNSLNFYKRSSIPAAGEQFEGKKATYVFPNIETDIYENIQVDQYDYYCSLPWNSLGSCIKSVTIVDEGIQPVSTAYWFGCFTNGSLQSITGLSKIDTSNVTNMEAMFSVGDNISTLDLSNFDTSKVTNMRYMFSGSSLTSLDLSGFDTSNVTDMSCMFSACPSLIELDLSSFDTSKVKSMQSMFLYDSSLKALITGEKWCTSSISESWSKPQFPVSMKDSITSQSFAQGSVIPDAAHSFIAEAQD